ncbi:NADH-ubiquinone oxidoreductase 9 subunit [Neolecta irregularis DAH-3]|uniref:NADH-ubiquinone oxidoreductase 9 subunit n=1 Tax=Neolecta irregularis (strain DAH-3) TaxID=1198029 RepID=A0A1U7LJN1_NEOID|nr:NADH-ubiquinone oxidoreductase 9 subunit [Neolecta irregularis DAH-3]|eukprot:OLL22731.1 NADH-ubiquinone oxidoreductase 9 subunit [Neolecta irregularis DAH-3]
MSSLTKWLAQKSREQPAIVWSVFIGTLGPVMVFTVRPFRRWLGYEKPEAIPFSYPVPQRSRRSLPSTYDDPVEDINRYTLWDKMRDTIASVAGK